MRILYHHRIASKDGQAVHVEEIVHALRANGHEVLLVGPAWMETRSFGFEGGLVARLKRFVPKFAYEILEYGYNVVAFARLWRAFRTFRPDAIYERYNLYFVASVWLRRLARVPLLLEVNAPLFEERGRYGGLGLPALARATERSAWRNADVVLPVTRVLGDRVVAAGVRPERIHVIPNGIDPGKFAAVPPLDAAKARLGLEGCLVLGFTGFMREWHGLEQLVDVVAQSADRFLLLVGDGPARASVEARAAELGIADRVRVTGIVPRDAIAAHVAAFDVALQPEVVEYASPLKLFEYLALGRAIAAPDRPNIREVLVHEENALLFAPGDPAAMKNAIERLCTDPQLRTRLGTGARKTIDARRLTWHANAERIADLARSLVARR
jgi:glycosyltransferase involved in cell wall biosynthesis